MAQDIMSVLSMLAMETPITDYLVFLNSSRDGMMVYLRANMDSLHFPPTMLDKSGPVSRSSPSKIATIGNI
jgi:hypothetical protein